MNGHPDRFIGVDGDLTSSSAVKFCIITLNQAFFAARAASLEARELFGRSQLSFIALELITKPELAERLRLSERAIDRLRFRHIIPWIRLGRVVRFLTRKRSRKLSRNIARSGRVSGVSHQSQRLPRLTKRKAKAVSLPYLETSTDSRSKIHAADAARTTPAVVLFAGS
jgi:hypothetical protein